MRGSCITLYSTLAVKAGVKKSGGVWSPNIIQHTGHPQAPPNIIPHLLGCPWCYFFTEGVKFTLRWRTARRVPWEAAAAAEVSPAKAALHVVKVVAVLHLTISSAVTVARYPTGSQTLSNKSTNIFS